MFFFLEYIKDLHIIVIKKECNHINDALLTSVLEGHTAVSWTILASNFKLGYYISRHVSSTQKNPDMLVYCRPLKIRVAISQNEFCVNFFLASLVQRERTGYDIWMQL